MAISFTGRKRVRKLFGRVPFSAEVPNLIETQKSSYDTFVKLGASEEERLQSTLEGVLQQTFPISDFSNTASLQYIRYILEEPKYDVEECRHRGMTFAAPLKVILQLVVYDVDAETQARSILDIKEQDVYMGDLPLMTETGTFVINGTERVVVSQMHRSPGVFFDHDKGKTHSSGKYLFSARVIPYRGSWLDFEFDSKDLLNVRIDRRRKLLASTFLYALGMSSEEILNHFYQNITVRREKNGYVMPFVASRWRGMRPEHDVVNAKSGEVIFEKAIKITPKVVRELETAKVKEVLIPAENLYGRYVAEDLINDRTGEIYIEAGDGFTEESLKALESAGVKEFRILDIDHINIGDYMRNTIAADKVEERDAALAEIYKVMRPGEPPTRETAEALFQGLFFDSDRYNLSSVGRNKMNIRLGLTCDDTVSVLRKEDVLACLKTLIDIKDGKGEVDDIDHLGNRRVRSVGELMENQYRIGLMRMERATRERMSSVDIDTVMPHDLINAKPVVAAVKEFFGSSQLSQFMDQTNPLSEITHKRRLSALGPGGLTRERAGFEVRDVHPTHYGRICPIETPEGPNIGLINSLATFARVNKYGFIETPYRKVLNGKVTDEVVHLSAMEEAKYIIAQANAEIDSRGRLTSELVSCRKAGEFMMSQPVNIELMDVSPKQLVSVAAALIPFLENDDANRALMGSNMQRQAVPLLQAEAPFVGTGMEDIVARDSHAAIAARRAGVVDQVDSTRIVIRATKDVKSDEPGVDIFNLQKFQRSNQSTCITQRPLVKVGDKVEKGDIIADGPSTHLGELALGRNVLVAFMPWHGYNFEDSILISERIVKEDTFTSIHIESFDAMARDTKLGPEDITRDIPNVGEEGLKNLDEAGIVYIGAEVNPGDILVGKITPKGESPITPEEKLLRAIFGEKASDVRDTSLRLPPGASGTVVEVRVFNRHGVDKDQRAMAIERFEEERLKKDKEDEANILRRNVYGRLKQLLLGKKVVTGVRALKKGAEIDDEGLESIKEHEWWSLSVADDKVMTNIEALKEQFDKANAALEKRFKTKKEKLESGDELPPGVMKMVKVFVAVKRKLQPGDKMAGRHGNKGVISLIVPEEDMPYLEDGTPVDIVLNPLGVPSRMNVGQIFETHLGWAARGLGVEVGRLLEQYHARKAKTDDVKKKLRDLYGAEDYKTHIETLKDSEIIELAENLKTGVPVATPVFEGANETDITAMLDKAGLDPSGQVELYDGRSGEKFDRKVTVGYIYMLKLHHLVDDKIHARSIGPYSLVTQQPLGGKAQFGGQRFGEMEVWALQAYGAAYTLQEMLTVKSDDVAGRTKVYEAIVKGDDAFDAGVPESFNVLVKEMRSLALNVDLKITDKS